MALLAAVVATSASRSAASDPGVTAGATSSSVCPQDEPVAPPRGWKGWDRSSVVAWEAIEQSGGVVPEIEEDRSQSPPVWWRYPSARRSEALLAAESNDAIWGLYREVRARDVASGDVLVRTSNAGVGSCGRMGMVIGNDDGRWVTVEAPSAEPVGSADGEPAHRVASPIFFGADGRTPLAGTRIFRIRVKKEETIGHLRELRRDLDHLERTVGDRPTFLSRAEGASDVVAEKVHDLVDEAWSLVAEESYDIDRRELTARALVLGAALDWPAAGESAAALLDDVLRREPTRPDALAARGMLAALGGAPARALEDARAAIALAPQRPRARWVEVRALEGSGRIDEAEQALRRFRVLDPRDVRAIRLEGHLRQDARRETEPGAKGSLGSAGSAGSQDADAPSAGAATPPLAAGPASASAPAILRYFATAERTGMESADLGFRISWPLTWRVAQVSATPDTGVIANLSTGRVLLDNGQADRASAVVLVQRPAGARARAAWLHAGVRRLFPAAKIKTLSPLWPGSRREQFLDKQAEGARAGEVVTLEKGGVVFLLVLNAPVEVYPKLQDEFESFARSLLVVPRAPARTTPPSSPPASATAAPAPQD